MDYYGNASAPMATTPKGREYRAVSNGEWVQSDVEEVLPKPIPEGTVIPCVTGRYSIVASTHCKGGVTILLLMRPHMVTPFVVTIALRDALYRAINEGIPFEWSNGSYSGDIHSAVSKYDRMVEIRNK